MGPQAHLALPRTNLTCARVKRDDSPYLSPNAHLPAGLPRVPSPLAPSPTLGTVILLAHLLHIHHALVPSRLRAPTPRAVTTPTLIIPSRKRALLRETSPWPSGMVRAVPAPLPRISTPCR